MNKRSALKQLRTIFATWLFAVAFCATAGSANGTEPSIEGTWGAIVIVSLDPPVSAIALSTFFPGGQAIEETNAPIIRSVGQGEWVRTGNRQFVRTMYILNFAAPRTFTGMTKVVNYFELNHDGDEYDSIGQFEVYDTNGGLLSSGQRTSHGKRCTAATTVPHCMGIGE